MEILSRFHTGHLQFLLPVGEICVKVCEFKLLIYMKLYSSSVKIGKSICGLYKLSEIYDDVVVRVVAYGDIVG